MIRIEVTSAVRQITWKEGAFNVQEAFAFLPGAKYPTRIEVTPPKGQQQYAPGLYTFDAFSLYVDRFGKLALGLKLQPLKA